MMDKVQAERYVDEEGVQCVVGSWQVESGEYIYRDFTSYSPLWYMFSGPFISKHICQGWVISLRTSVMVPEWLPVVGDIYT